MHQRGVQQSMMQYSAILYTTEFSVIDFAAERLGVRPGGSKLSNFEQGTDSVRH
jgi:hypothetical protein